MTTAVLSVGSNVGDSRALLRGVVAGFAGFGARVHAVSPVFATAPWGGVEQDDFLNITMIVADAVAPIEWLRRGAALEARAQRTREVRWGPRTLDVDVISVTEGDTVVRSDDPELLLPHPRAAQRAFVLVPWLAIDADARLWVPDGVTGGRARQPGTMRRVADLVAELPAADVAGVRELGWCEDRR
ncbi:MAG: 2-amino-4-hydroxy-6-hydroxymethyldihydropteridine diphosphokinase [Gordonia sp. (in: high G+C Gram-positive bacteria)]